MTCRLNIETFSVGWLGTNCYLCWDPVSLEALVIDPGDFSEVMAERIKHSGLTLTAICNTHGHVDHIAGNRRWKNLFGAPILIYHMDASMLGDPVMNLSSDFGAPVTSPPPDRLLQDGDEIPLGNGVFRVMPTPGHTKGSACFYQNPWLFAGDTLFRRSIGRTDFPGGDTRALISSIQGKLMSLPGDVQVFPGHGPATTIREEQENNPYLSGEMGELHAFL